MSRAVRSPLVLGAGGMLGRPLAALLEENCPGAVAATRAEIDITDRFRLEAEVERLGPDVIINCAAYTDVDGCETDPELARRVNAEGAENAARVSAAAGCRLVHISTDFVFDGAREAPYGEADRPAPLSVYGRTKLEGETRIAAALADHVIVRSSWLYGAGRRNFVDEIRRRARAGERLRVVRDQAGSPTWVADLAQAVVSLLATTHRGIVHFANAGACSRHELAVEIARLVCPEPPRIEAISTDDAGRLATRPVNSALDTALYTRLTGERPRPWKDALRHYLTGGSAGVGTA